METPTGGGVEKHRRGGAGEGEGGRTAKTVGWGAVEGEIPAARGEGGRADDVLGAIHHVKEEGCVVVGVVAGLDRGQGSDGFGGFAQTAV